MSQIIRDGLAGIKHKKPDPKNGYNSIPKKLQQRIATLKQKHQSWSARRIKYQYDLPYRWTTIHRVIKSNGMLVRIRLKPQPSKHFQRRNIDSMWQDDTFQSQGMIRCQKEH